MPDLQITAIIERLIQVFPEKRLSEETIRIYLEELSDIPVHLLDQAASLHIRTSTFFPRISELRQAARQIAGNPFFFTYPPSSMDWLALEAHQLEVAFFQRGEFDLNRWKTLARRLERMDRPHKAAELRQKARHIQQVISAEQRGEQYPSLADRLRYGEWESITKPGASV